MKQIPLLFLMAVLGGCATLPSEYAKAPGKSLVIGRKSNGVETLIRSVNDGETIYIKKNTLGNSVWLNPGLYSISIACVKNTTSEPVAENSTIELNVMTNHYYELRASFIDKKPNVQIEKYDISHIKKDPLKESSSRIF